MATLLDDFSNKSRLSSAEEKACWVPLLRFENGTHFFGQVLAFGDGKIGEKALNELIPDSKLPLRSLKPRWGLDSLFIKWQWEGSPTHFMQEGPRENLTPVAPQSALGCVKPAGCTSAWPLWWAVPPATSPLLGQLAQTVWHRAYFRRTTLVFLKHLIRAIEGLLNKIYG